MLQVTRHGAVVELMLNRPERRNALGDTLMATLATALDDAERDDKVRAIVLTGAPPAFCAGSDLKELGGLSVQDMSAHEARTAAVVRSIPMLSKPVVVGVEGYALGGGLILAAHCDVVITASNSRWHLPEVSNGWLPPWGLNALITRTGPVRGRLMTWGIEPIDGLEACRLGIADLVCEPGQARARAMEIAGRLAGLPPQAVVSTKRFFAQFTTSGSADIDRKASTIFVQNCSSDEAKATMARFGSPSGSSTPRPPEASPARN